MKGYMRGRGKDESSSIERKKKGLSVWARDWIQLLRLFYAFLLESLMIAFSIVNMVMAHIQTL
jgi:hypothetical protein